MTPQKILHNLHLYQKWRMGGKVPMPDPKEVGETLDEAIRLLRKMDKCGEPLFLAIAALRDDSDKNQWFVLNGNFNTDIHIQPCYKKWYFCEHDKIDCDKYRKATVPELIEHFKNQ